jgi:hypothetical protein
MAFAAAALPYLQYAGMAMSAVSAMQGSQANKDAANTQAGVSRNNAQIAEWQAQDAILRGSRSASVSRMRSNQLKGTQRAAMAANGVDLGQGSALQILSDTDYFGEIDALTIKDNAAKEAWALRNQAGGFTAEANLMQSRADKEKPWLAAGTSLLGSAGKVASSWYSPGSVATQSGGGYDAKANWRRYGSGGD